MLVLMAMAVVVVSGQEDSNHGGSSGTKGKTDGEPGANVEAHCCGMKGLGGATVEVLCHPQQIALSKPFTVNVKYASDIPRPVDVHVDVLNAKNKLFYAGKWEQMDDMMGNVSLTINMADKAEEPFLWKVRRSRSSSSRRRRRRRSRRRSRYHIACGECLVVVTQILP